MTSEQLRADFSTMCQLPHLRELRLSADQLESLFRYGEFLAQRSEVLNLVSQEDRPRLFTRHISECLVPGLVFHARNAGSLVDIGSGGGLPGIPLAIVAPELRALLVEPRQRKAQFLEAAVAHLGLDERVEVFQGTAEKLVLESAGQLGATLATARAVDRLAPVWSWCQGLLTPGGWLATYKGPGELDEELASLVAPSPVAHETFPCAGGSRVVLAVRRAP